MHFLLSHTHAHKLWLGLSSAKADGSSSRAGDRPCPAPARHACLPSALLSYACYDSSLPSGPGESCSPSKVNPQLPHSICFSLITHPTLPWGRREEERKGRVAKPRHWDYWPSLSPTCPHSPWPSPASPPPSNNTGNSANSFRQYPAPCLLPQIQGKQGGAEGQTEVGAGAASTPTPPELPSPTPSTQCLWIEPPLSTCSQNSACCPPPWFPWQQASRLGILSGL